MCDFFFDPPAEFRNVILVDSGTLRKAEKLIIRCGAAVLMMRNSRLTISSNRASKNANLSNAQAYAE